MRIQAKAMREEGLFRDAVDYAAFLNHLDSVKETLGFRIEAYCLLPGEVDLLLTLRTSTAGAIMHHLLGPYAKYYNRRHRVSGHVFSRRHTQSRCIGGQQRVETILEIHGRPITTGLVSDAALWTWSSHGELFRKRARWLLDANIPLEALRRAARAAGRPPSLLWVLSH